MLKTMLNRIEHNKNALKTKRYYVEDLISNEELIILVEEIEKLHSIIKEVREYIEKRKDTQKWRKESLKEKSTNIDIVLEHYRDILDILEKENDNGER